MPLPSLPKSDDLEFWGEDSQRISMPAVPIPLCETHEFTELDEGIAKCIKCPFGGRLPGYMRVKDGKIVDLRSLKTE